MLNNKQLEHIALERMAKAHGNDDEESCEKVYDSWFGMDYSERREVMAFCWGQADARIVQMINRIEAQRDSW